MKNEENNQFKLIQEDFIQKDKNNHPIQKKRKVYYSKVELFQNNDFPEGQIQADFFYQEHKFVPFALFVYYKKNDHNPKNEKIKKIFIKTLKSSIYKGKYSNKDENKRLELNRKFKLFELFTLSYWKTIGIDSGYDEFLYNRHWNKLRDRKEYGTSKVYDFDSEIFINIWNDYCLTEGKTSIDRKDFLLWLYRLNSIIYDLYRYPIVSLDAYQWQFRYLFLRELLKTKLSHDSEYYLEKNWDSLLKETFSKETATDARILDAKDLLNYFFKQVEPVSALERLLTDFYISFAEKLILDNILTRCEFCNEYILFKKGKKYCSFLVEKKDCGKKARNKRYYESTGKKNLESYKVKTRELRQFYKERNIKK